MDPSAITSWSRDRLERMLTRVTDDPLQRRIIMNVHKAYLRGILTEEEYCTVCRITRKCHEYPTGSERIQGWVNHLKWWLPTVVPRLDAYVREDGSVGLFWME